MGNGPNTLKDHKYTLSNMLKTIKRGNGGHLADAGAMGPKGEQRAMGSCEPFFYFLFFTIGILGAPPNRRSNGLRTSPSASGSSCF